MKKIIIINNGKEYYADNFEELMQLFFGLDYPQKNFNEKYKVRYDKALAISIKDELDLVDTRVGKLSENGEIVSKEYNFSKSFIIDNEITFMLSLCKFENVMILEERNSSVFNREGVTQFQGEDNYSVINKFCDELLLLNLKKML